MIISLIFDSLKVEKIEKNMKSSLPSELPLWYSIKENENNGTIEGWTPKTTNIKEAEVKNAWNGNIRKTDNKASNDANRIVLKDLYAISPIQIGGGSFPEGHILPAQFGGVPCIPGSSIRGAFLNWIDSQWENLGEKQCFWKKFFSENQNCSNKKLNWKPGKVRFEIIWINSLKAYPLNSQQDWQIFRNQLVEKKNINDLDRSKDSEKELLSSGKEKPILKKNRKKSKKIKLETRKLTIQWQIEAEKIKNQNLEESQKWRRLNNSENRIDSISISILFRESIDEVDKSKFKNQLKQMLLQQGIGRGTATGFGRLMKEISPEKKWLLKLKGMKPAINSRNIKKQIEGEYRWNPQVLKACLRGYFIRLALTIMSDTDAKKLTNIIFGRLGKRAKLSLTSYLSKGKIKTEQSRNNNNLYTNIPKDIIDSVWEIEINCNNEFQSLIDKLLFLASNLGGLGPGWRRPPHHFFCKKVYRGSSFTVNCDCNKQSLVEVINELQNQIDLLANQYGIIPKYPKQLNLGSLASIWENKMGDKWVNIVHGICKTNAKNRPDIWCGNQTQPSSYAVKQQSKDCCLITVFHFFDSEQKNSLDIQETLIDNKFTKIWSWQSKD